MAYASDLFHVNFLEYASYVIKDRAIPDLIDGMKPVQRRILHTLMEIDDGRFHKVANVVGQAMKYHPHGDASIKDALVNLANKELFIDKQGNFGNIYTGDAAAAGRYIECRILPFGKSLIYSPQVTPYEDSYDGRNREPVVFPAKVPLVLILGAEGIAVGMSTKILPHNFKEVVEAVQHALRGEPFTLYPDFITGGILDVSEYGDGNGRVLVRAKFDISKDEKRITIREIPYGTTTESLIDSIQAAAKKGRLKLQSISDFSKATAEIEIKLARGVHAQEMIDSLYAYTDCEVSIPVNLLVIQNRLPAVLSVTEVIQFHARFLQQVLRDELTDEEGKLREQRHAKTLERIFIEERIYKRIETQQTHEGVVRAVVTGFEPFIDQIKRPVSETDVERLLKIPIRRISLYDMNKMREEMQAIDDRLKIIDHHLNHLVDYALATLDSIQAAAPKALLKRSAQIAAFDAVDLREVVKRDRSLFYDWQRGYLGTEERGGKPLLQVSELDRVLLVKPDSYQVIKVPEKLFIGKGLLYCGHVDEAVVSRVVFSLVYVNADRQPYLKRFQITQFITDRLYPLVPPGCKTVAFTTRETALLKLTYKPKPRLKTLEADFSLSDYSVKGVKAQGVRLSTKELKAAQFSVEKKQKTN